MAKNNPYIGPRTFQRNEGHLFFGREREARDLIALVASERLVVFYAQSGAGKSSIVNTRLISNLEGKEYEVLPVGRLSGDLTAGESVNNIYVHNLIRSLEQHDTNPKVFASLTISDFLAHVNYDNKGFFYDPTPVEVDPKANPSEVARRALIIDQFEELFSTHPESWEKRENFFEQLAKAMEDDPQLWVVLVMREDFIAALDPYAHHIYNGLRVRYYMQRLEREAALKAVTNPVKELRPYAQGVAEKLIDDLCSITVQKPDGKLDIQPGQYVEPVQLQVVCYGLWDNLPTEGTQITEKDLQDVGDVNQSLGKYYDKRVGEVAKVKNVRERLIREWFEKKLITTGNVRNMVLQETKKKSGELDDDVIRALQSDLVRAEKRGGATWYELTHDRLVEPILERNKLWFTEHLSPLQRQAALWKDQNENDSWLLSDQALIEVEQWAKEHPDELTDAEQEFLETCRKQQKEKELEARRKSDDQEREIQQQKLESAQKQLELATKLAEEQMRSAKRARRFNVIAFSLVAISICGFIFAACQSIIAKASTRAAIKAKATAVVAQMTAIANAQSAATAQADAIVNEQEASKQAQIAFSGLVSAQSNALQAKNFQISMLLGIEAYKSFANFQSLGTLLNATQANPRLSRYLNGNSSEVLTIAYSLDGKYVVSGSLDNTARVWEVATGREVSRMTHDAGVSSVDFSPDGKYVASGSLDNTVRVWEAATGREVTRMIHDAGVSSVAFSPDGKYVASGSYDHTARLWEVITGKEVARMTHNREVSSIAFSPNGKTLASGSYDNSIILWDVEAHQPIGQPLIRHTDVVTSVTFSPDGKILASSSADNTIILWNVETHQPIDQPLNRHKNSVNSVAFSPNGKMVASGSADNTIILWDVETHQPIGQPLSGHTNIVNSVAFSSDGKALASGSADNTIILWDVDTHQPISRPLAEHTDSVNSVAFSPDGKTLASGSADNTIILWDIEAHQPIGQPLTGHTNIVTSVAFGPDGKALASGGADNTIILWDVNTHPPIGQTLIGHTSIVTSVAFSPDGKTLASGSYDNTIILWDVATRQPIGQPLIGHTSILPSSVAFNLDGKMLASGSYDKTIILWDVETHQPIGQPLTGHTDSVISVAFSPDGKTLASITRSSCGM